MCLACRCGGLAVLLKRRAEVSARTRRHADAEPSWRGRTRARVRAGAGRRTCTGGRRRPLVPRRSRPDRWRLPRRVSLLHLVGLPHHDPPPARARGERPHLRACILATAHSSSRACRAPDDRGGRGLCTVVARSDSATSPAGRRGGFGRGRGQLALCICGPRVCGPVLGSEPAAAPVVARDRGAVLRRPAAHRGPGVAGWQSQTCRAPRRCGRCRAAGRIHRGGVHERRRHARLLRNPYACR